MSVATKVRKTRVVSEDEDDVWPLLRCISGMQRGQWREQQGREECDGVLHEAKGLSKADEDTRGLRMHFNKEADSSKGAHRGIEAR
jgi:hypothetical protein